VPLLECVTLVPNQSREKSLGDVRRGPRLGGTIKTERTSEDIVKLQEGMWSNSNTMTATRRTLPGRKLRVTLLRDNSEECCSKGNWMRRQASFGDLQRRRSSGWSLGKKHPNASMGGLHKSRLSK
jgi:hypothetical protein